jgi:hypothetical protein
VREEESLGKSLGKSLGESLEELLPKSNHWVTKLLCRSQDSERERREIISWLILVDADCSFISATGSKRERREIISWLILVYADCSTTLKSAKLLCYLKGTRSLTHLEAIFVNMIYLIRNNGPTLVVVCSCFEVGAVA